MMKFRIAGGWRMRYLMLISFTLGFVAGCGEAKPPAATSSPSTTASAPVAKESAPPPVVPAKQEPAQPATAPATSAAPAQPKNLAARKLDPEKIKRGEAVYRKNCASCHGPNGEATPGWRNPGADGRYPPPPLDGSAHAWHHSTETLEEMIRKGSPGGGGMPPWDGKLTNQEIDDVIVWIKSLWPDDVYDVWHNEIEHKPQPKQK